MFKNCIPYSITLPQGAGTNDDIGTALGRQHFVDCGATQEKSCGWVPPRHEYGAMSESINGHLIAAFCVQTKTVPKDAIDEKVNVAANEIEQTTGHKLGKKRRRALADDARLELLPHAFPKTKEAYVWIDREAGRLYIDTSSQSFADEAVTSLVNLFEGAFIAPINTKNNPATIMAHWLHHGDDLDDADRSGFALGRACVLKSSDEEKSQVAYKRCSLDSDEIREHIERGLLPGRLDLTFDGRMDLTLHESLKLTGIKVLDVAIDPAEPVDAFDADVAIITSELSKAVGALIDGPLGGIAGAEGGAP